MKEVAEVPRVDQVYGIRHKVLVEGLGIRRVSREMRVRRNTVRRYLTVPEPVRRACKARERPVADAVSFLDGDVKAFEHFGAVPQRLIYDNLSAAVRRMMLPERALTARFAALANHYLFERCIARPGTGYDKGEVESRGKAIRLQELAPIPARKSLREIGEKLLARLDDAGQHRRHSALDSRSPVDYEREKHAA